MNPKKRLKMSLNGERVDRPPCICPGGMMNMVTAELMERVGIYLPEAHTDARKMADLAKAVYEQGCFENCGVPFCMTIEAEEMGARVDLGSQIYEPHVVKYAIDSVSDYEKLSGDRSDKRPCESSAGCNRNVERRSERYADHR